MGQIPQNTNLFNENYWANGLDHVSQVMGYHPSYLNHFLKTQNFILRGDGPLPYAYRHYIAIMAAGRHQCSYLIALQKQEFILQGGNNSWLKGLNHIPPKLRNLYEINKILAHRPWLLTRSHIEKLTKGKDSWSLAEVVHAIVILTHFHSLCCFVFSCGLNQEVQGENHYQSEELSAKTNNSPSKCKSKEVPRVDTNVNQDWKNTASSPPSPTEPEVGITTLIQKMKTLSQKSEECTPVELAKRFEHIESQSAEIGAVGPEPQETPADIDCFVDEGNFIYQDYAKRSDPHRFPIFRVQDYSWDDHGYSLVNRLYNDVGHLLDDKFKTAYNLTYYTMGGRTEVDTSRFRRAIWNYIQCLFGIRHDDYNYGEVNALLERSLKAFIKSASCYPERVTKKDYDRVLREFEHSEKTLPKIRGIVMQNPWKDVSHIYELKEGQECYYAFLKFVGHSNKYAKFQVLRLFGQSAVHVNLMVLESRMQAELMYALRTVNCYMTN